MTIPLMIDSGAYSADTRGEKIDIDAYIAFCHEILEDHPEAVVVNLDVIGDGPGSYRNWRIMRRAGLQPLPIYHAWTDEKWLRFYLKETNHVGIGAIAGMNQSNRKTSLDRLWETYLIDPETRMPTCKVHGMGITSFPLLRRYPWHSVDSTSWLQVAMFGHVFVPKRTNGAWDFSKTPIKVGFSTLCGDKKNRSKHYTTLSPPERKVLHLYLKEMGHKLGFECPIEGKPKTVKAVLRGLATWHGARSDLVAEFFAGFLRSMPYPRPFPKVRTKGFGL